MITINSSILTYLTIFSLEGMGKICCHSSVFLIRPTPTHNNSLRVNLKISIFWFADPILDRPRSNLKVLLILLQVCTVVVTHKFREEFEILEGKVPPQQP